MVHINLRLSAIHDAIRSQCDRAHHIRRRKADQDRFGGVGNGHRRWMADRAQGRSPGQGRGVEIEHMDLKSTG
jgi:hypothetical protein